MSYDPLLMTGMQRMPKKMIKKWYVHGFSLFFWFPLPWGYPKNGGLMENHGKSIYKWMICDTSMT
jgi:hypothetical protein